MDDYDYWRLCDDLSIFQAALLIVGEDPSGESANSENWPTAQRPVGYEAAKTALINALKQESIVGKICFEYDYDATGDMIEGTGTVDLAGSTISVDSLKEYLKKTGFRTGFFFPDSSDDRSYLDLDNDYYAPKLAAAVKVWEEVSSNESLLIGKTPKQAVEKWLREHASEYGLTDADGNPVNAAIEQIAKVVNWKPEGGAAKTPTPTQVKSNPTTPEKTDNDQSISFDEDSEIPF